MRQPAESVASAGLPYLVSTFVAPPFARPGFMSYAGDVDYLGVHSNGGSFLFQLLDLFFDGGLELLKPDGATIASSGSAGIVGEKIVTKLPPGDYLLRVTGRARAFDPVRPSLVMATQLKS